LCPCVAYQARFPPTQPSLHNLLHYVLQLLSIRQTDRPTDRSLDRSIACGLLHRSNARVCHWAARNCPFSVVEFVFEESSFRLVVLHWRRRRTTTTSLLHKTMNPRRCDITGFLPCFFIMSSSSYVVCVCLCVCVGFFCLFDDALMISFFAFVVVWFRSRMCVVGTFYLVHDGGVSLLYFRVGNFRFSGLCLCLFLWFTSLFKWSGFLVDLVPGVPDRSPGLVGGKKRKNESVLTSFSNV